MTVERGADKVTPVCIEPHFDPFNERPPGDDGKWPWGACLIFIVAAAAALWSLIGFAVIGWQRGWF